MVAVPNFLRVSFVQIEGDYLQEEPHILDHVEYGYCYCLCKDCKTGSLCKCKECRCHR